MSTTTMHFGPEWMRAKQPHAAARPHAIPSPPPASTAQIANSGGSPAPQGASSYSALLTPSVPPVQAERDLAHPFKYSRDEILQVWKDGGGRGPLPIEVEMWEGVVREMAGEPACLRELTEAEKKLFATGLNSELRRRQSTDFIGQAERGKLLHANSSHGGALREGLGIMGRRRRGDSTGADQPPLSLPRKTSWSNAGSLVSPSLPSPRTRVGNNSTASNFDGVLNGNETPWTSGKSRVLPGQTFAARTKNGDTLKDTSELEIKEEEETSDANAENGNLQPPEPEISLLPTNVADLNGLSNNVEKLSITTNHIEPQNHAPPPVGPGSNGVHWDEALFAAMQWSYVDPLGNIQGPFSGEAMQSWHDQHYFTDDLMMKRTTIDSEFIPVAEIKRRAQGERIFLCPLGDPAPPPGLLRQVPPPGLNAFVNRNAIDSPSQPSPQGAIRSSTLDSYLTGVQSASPVSSFGGGLARPSISPDPMAVGSRLANARFAADLPLSGRVSAGSYSSTGSPAVPQAIRSVFNDVRQPTRQSSFESPQYGNNVLANVPWQTPHMNGSGWNGVSDNGPQVDPFGLAMGNVTPGNGHSPFLREPQYNAPLGPQGNGVFPVSAEHARGLYEHHSPADIIARLQTREDVGFAQVSSPSRFAGAPQQLSMSPLTTGLNREYDQANSPVVASPGRMQPQGRNALSPWAVAEHQRPRPFEADHPTASNTYVATPSSTAQPAWSRPAAETQVQPSHIPWIADQQSNSNEAWPQLTDEPQGLGVSNVPPQKETKGGVSPEEKTQVHKSEINAPDTSTPTSATSAAPVQTHQTSPVTKKENGETSPAPAHSKKKGNASVPVAAQEPPQPAPTRPSLATSPSQRSAWATDEEKAKPAAPMGLREIQEAEKKRQEARKASEIERERAARAAAGASPTEDVQYTASWGLPTSRAGARADNIVTAKDTASSPSTSGTPVWTNATKPAAKTMKEILEEEERRKLQAAKEKETIASTAKRAAQGGPPKGIVASVPLTGGAWTTVGASGKTNVIAAAAAAPRVGSSTQTPSVSAPAASVPRPAPVPVRQVATPPVAKAPSSTPKIEDTGTPSPEFLKWMRDSLKGLNSTVQFEEIAQMLLSFPLDPDKATVELISETVYGASTTLDGRRFATEFIAKRKVDAATRRGAPGLSDANGRPASLADVVKAQPKPAQNEFGGYKVVKKKNKGGRS